MEASHPSWHQGEVVLQEEAVEVHRRSHQGPEVEEVGEEDRQTQAWEEEGVHRHRNQA